MILPFAFPPAVYENPISSTSLPVLDMVSQSLMLTLSKCVGLSQCGFNCISPEICGFEHFLMSLFATLYILYNFCYHLPIFLHKLWLFPFLFMNKTLKQCPVHRNHSINLRCLKTLIFCPHPTMSEFIGLGLGLRSNISSKSFSSADERGQCRDETENKFSREGQAASL